MNTANLRAAKSELKKEMAGGDVRAGLRYLNGLTRHRFTGLYLFEDPQLKNEYIFDKKNPDTESFPDNVPVTATYCSFTRSQGGGGLAIENAPEDDRAEGHPARHEIQSYCGVPLVNKMGEIYGTICHFDHKPIRISDTNVELMEAVAPILERCFALT
jgi:hypothetical protein